MTQPTENDENLLRYSRHLLLDSIGIAGQKRIAKSTALVVGAGGLGCPAALYLASAGVGRIIIADPDQVDLTNLQRQILHTTSRLGQTKVHSAKIALEAINPEIEIVPLAKKLADEQLIQQAEVANVILDCCDNFDTRYAINQASLATQTPLVSGAAVELSGQLTCFNPTEPGQPCYQCLFPPGEDVVETRCATMGVFAPLTGVIGTLQSAEALKIIARFGHPLYGQLLRYDALTGQFKTCTFSKDPECQACQPR